MNNDERRIKRPDFIIFTDKDGTLNLKDKKLNSIMSLILSMNGMVIPITGRTVGDILESLKSNNIRMPAILVGDNGANIYSTSQEKFLFKKSIDREKVKTIIEHFISIGGQEHNIRLTDGTNIYAIANSDVKAYYKKSKSVVYCDDIEEILSTMPEITKLTLAGSEEQMLQMTDYSEEIGFCTDIGATKFPIREQGNYRLDVTDRDISKGEAVRSITSLLKPRYGYMCIGNGENDISMFKQAIDDGMIAGLMEESPDTVKEEMKKYSSLKHKR